MKKILEKLYRVSWLKYAVVTVLAVVLIGFVDENSVWHHFMNQRRISELKAEIERLTAQHDYDQKQIKLLNTDSKAIEKVARERYFMKEDDEDIFVFSGEQSQAIPYDDETVE